MKKQFVRISLWITSWVHLIRIGLPISDQNWGFEIQYPITPLEAYAWADWVTQAAVYCDVRPIFSNDGWMVDVPFDFLYGEYGHRGHLHDMHRKDPNHITKYIDLNTKFGFKVKTQCGLDK